MILSKNELSTYSLVNALKNAFFDIDSIEENEFSVKSDRFFIGVRIDTESERLSLFHLHDAKEYDEKFFLKAIIASNEANSNMAFIRTNASHIHGRIFVVFDYTYRYDKGFNIAQFASDIKFFEKVMLSTFQEYFQEIF